MEQRSLFTLSSNHNTHPFDTREPPNTADLPKNVQCRESEEKKSDFEENNYTEPRQMPKCSFSDAFDE